MYARSRQERRPVTNYFIRRFFRIAPTFYCVVAVYLWLFQHGYILVDFPVSTHGWRLASILLFVNGFRPDTINSPVIGQWSIAVEVLFYMLLPAVFPFIRTYGRAVSMWFVTLSLFFVSYPIAVWLAKEEGFTPTNMATKLFALWWIPSQLPIFVGGIATFYVLRSREPTRVWSLPFVFGVGLIIAVRQFYPTTCWVPAVGVMFMVIVVALAHHPVRLLVNPITKVLGKVSFSAYLLHPLCLTLALRGLTLFWSVSFSKLFAITLALTVPLSWLVWRWCEIPFQNLGKKLIVVLEEKQL